MLSLGALWNLAEDHHTSERCQIVARSISSGRSNATHTPFTPGNIMLAYGFAHCELVLAGPATVEQSIPTSSRECHAILKPWQLCCSLAAAITVSSFFSACRKLVQCARSHLCPALLAIKTGKLIMVLGHCLQQEALSQPQEHKYCDACWLVFSWHAGEVLDIDTKPNQTHETRIKRIVLLPYLQCSGFQGVNRTFKQQSCSVSTLNRNLQRVWEYLPRCQRRRLPPPPPPPPRQNWLLLS